jgi:hypothetical protein
MLIAKVKNLCRVSQSKFFRVGGWMNLAINQNWKGGGGNF